MNRTMVCAVLAGALLVTFPAGAIDPELHQIGSVNDLKTAFNRDQGVPRLVLLLSPT